MPTQRFCKGVAVLPGLSRRDQNVMPNLLRVDRGAVLRERVPLSVKWLGGLLVCIVIAVEGGYLLHQDATMLRQMQSGTAPAKASDIAAGEVEGAAAAPAPSLPKVALMFLTRGPMPLEPVWESFLSAASNIVHSGVAQTAGRSSPIRRCLSQQAELPGHKAASFAAADSTSADSAALVGREAWEVLFSLYAHPPPDFSYPPGSIFKGHEVPGRLAVQWGQHSVVEAERALLRAALADPLNQRFVLLSDSCIPLYPLATVYWQLMSEQRSRMNACKNDSDPKDWQHRMDYRWHPNMQAASVSKEQWRKSSQWKMLVRRHAELVANDSMVNAVFSRECWADMKPPVHRFCVSDEHYVPTLLAHLGLEGECECGGQLTHVHWDGPYFHPKTYGKAEASNETLALLRGEGCSWSEVKGSRARKGIASVLEQLKRQPAKPAVSSVGGGSGNSRIIVSSRALKGGEGEEEEVSTEAAEHGDPEGLRGAFRLLAQRAAALDGALLEARCPLFARKIAGDAASEWGRLLQSVVRQRRKH